MGPRIGVMPLRKDKDGSGWATPSYSEALRACGARPVVFPWGAPAALAEELAESCDGFLFTGGHDIDPKMYGQVPSPAGDYSPTRDRLEEFVLMGALARNVPVLGICRGMQLLNVILGGTLYQDLLRERPGSIFHPVWTSYEEPAHEVELVEGSPLRRVLGVGCLSVNSRHHQGIHKLASDVRPMAYATDGLVESIYHPNMRFLWGVQWHPESMYVVQPRQRLLFQTFVDACADVHVGEA